jgi:hypothetical protein
MSHVGKKIRHNLWGEGVVLAQRHDGYEFFVKFDNGARSWIKRSECVYQDLPIGTVTITGEKGPKEASREDENKLLKLQALEAFKLGIVPPHVKEFIFGREKEINYFKDWFKNSNKHTCLIFGQYGTGKTHFLNYLKEMSLKENYSVSLCSVDPTESPLYKPLYVYREIIENFTYGNGKNFEDFINEVRKNSKHIKKKNAYIYNITKIDPRDDLFWRWIKGENLVKTYHNFPTLYNFSTSGNIFCNILSFYSWFCKNFLDLNGFVILFDEAEAIEFPTYNYRYVRSCNFFKGLRMTAENNEDLLSETVSLSSPKTGRSTGLIYSGFASQVEYLYDSESYLKLVFAFTHGKDIMSLCTDAGYEVYIELKRLTKKSKIEAFNSIKETYEESHDLSITKKDEQIIRDIVLKNPDENIRAIVKKTIEALDLFRHYQGKNIRDILK